jgi:hypothetical protein
MSHKPFKGELMRAIYIGGGQRSKKNDGTSWKIYMFLFLFFAIIGSGLKLTAPMIVEEWINRNGAGASGYAFSIRDVDLSLSKGEMVLKDVKIFNPKSSTELVEVPNLTVHLSLSDLILYQDKKLSIIADKVDLIISKNFSSEIQRIQAVGEKHKKDFYLDSVEGKIVKLNIIEKKESISRTMLELNDVNVKVKEVGLLSTNKKSEFTITSNVAAGGKLSLTGKISEENGSTPWSIHGSLKQVTADIFNKVAGDKLPFSFNQSSIDAEIVAHSEHGKVSGEISPDIKRLNLIDERPGIPTQTIARALTDELTFVLPFTLKDALTLEYADTYRRLKTYRKDSGSIVGSGPAPASAPAKVTQTTKAKKSFSFWPF